MKLSDYKYVNITQLTGDIASDVNNFLLSNSKPKTLSHVINVANTNIECHTTLKPNPSPYDMALFIADKLSWDQ